jgi:hypothetical protein
VATKTGTPAPRRLPKSKRIHERRLKQAARKDGTVYRKPA